MRILHVFETIPGGPATYLNETIPFQLEQFGVENVRILAPAVHLTHIKNIPETCVASFNRTGRYSSLPALAVEVHRQVKRFRPQIIHAHSTFAGVIVRSLGAVSPNFPPIIYCPHGWVFDMDTLGVFRRPARWTERLLSSFCHKIVAISQHEYRQGIEAGVSPDRMVVIENGIAAEAPRFEPTAWKDDRTKVLFIGRLDRQKGVDVLLRAAALLRDKAVFKIIGAHVTNKSLLPRDVSDNVEFLGWKSPQEISSYLAVCDVVAMPSRWEGFGLVALEAMRSSKPVIASAVGGLQSVVSDGETGHLVPAGNHESLAATIMAHDKSGWAAMGAAGYQRFMARYTSDRTSRELMALYRDVIHRSHASQKALA